MEKQRNGQISLITDSDNSPVRRSRSDLHEADLMNRANGGGDGIDGDSLSNDSGLHQRKQTVNGSVSSN